MPSTHPSGTLLARHRVTTSSICLTGTSQLHSNEVNSTGADLTALLLESNSLPPRGVASLHGVAAKKRSVSMDGLSNSCLHHAPHTWHIISDWMHHHVFYFTPSVFHFSFTLKCICLHQDNITRHELNCAGCCIIISLPSVHLTVQLELCLCISFLEVFPYLLNVSGDSA